MHLLGYGKGLPAALEEVLSAQEHVGISDGINVGITNEAVSTQEKLLSIVEENPFITASQIAEALSLSKRQAERLIAKLKAEGRLVRIGANRNGRWEVR